MDIKPAASSATGAPAVHVERSTAHTASKAAEAVRASAQAQSAEKEKPEPVGNVDEAVKNINNVLSMRSQSLEFSVDEESDRTIVSVIDKETQEVIRQMPSREALEIAKALDQLQSLLKKQSA